MMRGGCLGNGGRTLIQFDDVDIGGMFGKKLPHGLQAHWDLLINDRFNLSQGRRSVNIVD